MRLKDKRVIVTGGLGFVGSHLVNKLTDEGAYVLVIDNLNSGSIENKDTRLPDENYLIVDFTDKDLMTNIFNQFKPDYVFHVGAWGRMPMCLEDPIGAYKNNLMGSLNILEASKISKATKVVLSSSCIVYCEDTPYKGSKLAMEEAAKIYRSYYNLPTISLRYANIYGTRQNVEKDSAMFAMLRKSFNEKGFVEIFGDGEQTRDWIHVDDVCEANILSALSKFTGEYDICTGISIPLNLIVNHYLKVPAVYKPKRTGDAMHIKLLPMRAMIDLKFSSKITLEDGIKDIWK